MITESYSGKNSVVGCGHSQPTVGMSGALRVIFSQPHRLRCSIGRPTMMMAFGIIVLAGILCACPASHSKENSPESPGVSRLESAIAYLSAPQAVLEANVGSELAGRRLLRCYETEMTDPVLQSTAVMVRLTLTSGGDLRSEIVSTRTGLSQAFSDCLGTVIHQWDFQVETGSETVLPLEFGPRQ